MTVGPSELPFPQTQGYMSDVVNSSERKQKVVVLRELHKAIIYTTKISKQVTKGHVRDAVHMYLVN
jgi:hypothetical protein